MNEELLKNALHHIGNAWAACYALKGRTKDENQVQELDEINTILYDLELKVILYGAKHAK